MGPEKDKGWTNLEKDAENEFSILNLPILDTQHMGRVDFTFLSF